MVYQAARAVKLISESIGLPTVDEENERLFAEDGLRTFLVPVTLKREGFVRVRAGDAKSAEAAAKAGATFADDFEGSIHRNEIGSAIEA